MKKKMMVYLGLITMISAFFVVPISALAESLSEAPVAGSIELPQQNQVPLFTEESSSLDKNKPKTSENEMESSMEESIEPIEETIDRTKYVVDGEQDSTQQSEKKPLDDSSYANLTLELDPPREGNKFFTGEEIQFYQTIKSSSEQLNKEPYSLINISKEFVDKESIEVHADKSIKSYEILDEKPNTWTIRINYKAITSGGIVSVPISFNQRNYTTAPNSETTISSSLYFEETLLSEDSLSVYAETIEPKLKKEVHTPEVLDGKVEIGLESENEKGVSSSNDAELKTVMYELTVTIATSDGYGVFVDSYGKIVDRLPKEAKFVKASSNADYDEKTHTVSFSIPKNEKPVGAIIWERVYVNFPNTKELEPILNEAELKNRLGDTVVAQASATFIPTLGKRDIYIVGGLSKTVQGKKYGRYIGEKPDDIVWDVSPTIKDNPYNKDAYIKELEDIVDNQQEYSKVKLSIPNNVEYDAISLYGAKKDGTYQLIKENVLVGEDINLTNDFSKIKIVFDKPVKYSKNIKLYVTSKVKEDLWTTGMDGKQVNNTANVIYSDPEGNILGSRSVVENVNYEAANISFSTSIDARKKVDGHVNDVKNLHYRVNFTSVKDGEEAFIVTLLPNGVTPIPDSEKFVVINNYLNTGKIAVLQKITNENNKLKTSNLPIKITGTLGKGEHQIQHYIYWENKTIVPKTEFYSYLIKNNLLDFDKLGTYIGRNIVGDTDRINHYPPLEVMVLKRIGTSSKNLSEVPIEVSDKDDIYYEINLENRTNQAIENYYFYDVLPFPGDKVSDQKNGSINNSRGSNNSVTFSEIVSKDDNLDLYYSSETNIDNLKTASWQKLESSTPINQIKSIKAVPTIKIEANQKMSVIFKVKAHEMKGTSVTKNAALLSQKNQNVLVDSNTVEAKNIKPEVVTIKGIKTWKDQDNKDGNRPENITVNLLADGTKVDSREISKASDWKFEFKDVAIYKNNQEIKYSVEEVKVTNYETKVDAEDLSNIQITNTYKPETTEVEGIKTWVDEDNKAGNRPETIKVNVLVDDKVVASQEVSEATNWSYKFENLPKYEKGKEIVYTVSEDEVIDYETTVTGTNLTNTYKPEIIKIEGIKTWVDEDNKAGNRPETIKVNVLVDDKVVASQEVSEATNWSYKFENLPKYEKGKEIVYTVSEDEVIDYETTVTGTNLTNTYNQEKTFIEGKKIWKDDNNKAGNRPDEITVNLLANGKPAGSQEVSEATNWAYKFENLAKYEKGKEIAYTVTENSVLDYTTEIKDTTIINHYTPSKTSVTVTKEWQDDNNQNKKRPESIEVQLVAGKQKQGEKVTLNVENNWSYTWSDLNQKVNGENISYTVEEVTVPYYKSSIDATDKGNIRLVNTLITPEEPEKTTVKGSKIWEDNENQDGKRPNTITVVLLADGKEIQSKEISAANNWRFEFKDLEQYKNKKEIEYKVKEVVVPEYEVRIDQDNKENIQIINTYTPKRTEVKGSKKWKDSDNQDGKRPEKITVNLLADGKQVADQEVSEADNWQYEFKDLAKYQNGQEILYTVTENQVPEYQTSISGYNITNTYTPGKTSVTVTKQWEDNNNQDGIRPNTIKVQLLANGEKLGDVETLSPTNNWQFTWNNLAKKEKGKEILYTIKEVGVSGYEAVVDDTDSGNIKLLNRYIPEITSVKGSKTWKDNDNQDGKRPEKIIVNLLADGKEVDQKEVTESSDWNYEFTNLPKYQNGQEISYTVTENQVPEYQTSISGYDITNTYSPGKTSVTVSKQWEDNNNQDGIRPEIIQVQLLANGNKQEEVVLSVENKWSYTWNDLNQKEKGKDINYTIEEVKVPGYVSTVDTTDKGNIKLVNTHLLEETAIKGNKIWKDNDNKAGKRPEKITVNLLADGKQVAEKEVTNATEWRYEFTDLPKYQNGLEIVYTVTENHVPDYQSKVSGFDIINTYTPGKTSVTMTKEWLDNNDKDKMRPDSIKVQLLANGEKQGEVVVITKNDKWHYTWSDLAMVDDKEKPIRYTVTEVDVPKGYTAMYKESTVGNLSITNSHTSLTPKIPNKIIPPTTTKTGGVLPKTGEERVNWMPLLGLAFIVLTSRVIYIKRKEN